MSVHKKLMQARIKLQGMELKKSGENKFAGYKYFELGDFLPQTQQIFHDLGLCSIVSFRPDVATLDIIDTEDGTIITISSPMAEAQLKGAHPIQNLGAVESYQRRYLWMAAMEVVEHDMIDASTGSEPPPKPKAIPAPTGKPPNKIEGKELPWQIKVNMNYQEDLPKWVEMVLQMTRTGLSAAKSEKDVGDIFRVNRNIFDTLKSEAPEDYEVLVEEFKKRKLDFEEV